MMQELGLASPEDLFDIETFRDDPRPFYKFAKDLYPGSIKPGPSHSFLASLDSLGKLLRIYTQNVDALEELAGVRSEKVMCTPNRFVSRLHCLFLSPL